MIKKVIMNPDLSKASGPDCISVVVLMMMMMMMMMNCFCRELSTKELLA